VNTKLSEIITITSGIYSKFGQLGNATYLQANYFNEAGKLDDNIRPNLILNKQTERHLLNEGDILFAAKGAKNFAVSIKNKMGACVASSTFLVLRIKSDFQKRVLSEYLVWFLNHPHNLAHLKAKATGTGVPSISKKTLDEMEIILPATITQESIVIIDDLRSREKELKVKIETLKEKQIQQLLYNLTIEKIMLNGK
jgi:restriction endonuclease S subunit